MNSNYVKLIEVFLVFGAVGLWGWWQLREVSRDQKESALKKQLKEKEKNKGKEE